MPLICLKVEKGVLGISLVPLPYALVMGTDSLLLGVFLVWAGDPRVGVAWVALREEWPERTIGVSSVAPGGVITLVPDWVVIDTARPVGRYGSDEESHPRTRRWYPIDKSANYARIEPKGGESYCCTTSYPSFISPSAILNPAHTQSINAAPFATPNTNVDA